VGRGPASGSSSSQRNVHLKISDWASNSMVGLTFSWIYFGIFRRYMLLPPSQNNCTC
jgi:hypothetical protein